jgi:hypothetical protein
MAKSWPGDPATVATAPNGAGRTPTTRGMNCTGSDLPSNPFAWTPRRTRPTFFASSDHLRRDNSRGTAWTNSGPNSRARCLATNTDRATHAKPTIAEATPNPSTNFGARISKNTTASVNPIARRISDHSPSQLAAHPSTSGALGVALPRQLAPPLATRSTSLVVQPLSHSPARAENAPAATNS